MSKANFKELQATGRLEAGNDYRVV